MDLLSLKIIVLTLSGLIRLFFGLIPILLIRSLSKNSLSERRSKYLISLLMFFGGGVLLATTFLHMMPEVRKSLNSLTESTELPVPEIIFISGFFLVYLIEDIVHGLINRRRKNRKKAAHLPKNAYGTTNVNSIYFSGSNNSNNRSTYEANNEFFPNSLIPRVRGGTLENSKGQKQGGSVVDPKFCYVDPDWWKENTNSQLSLVGPDNAPSLSSSMHEISLNSPHSINYSKNRQNHEHNNHTHHHHNHHSHHIPFDEENEESSSVGGTIRNIVLLVAISFHGIFEGLAIGLEGSDKDVWALFLAVSIHECTIFFCIGVELLSAKTKLSRMVTYITVVSLVSPLGTGIGILISENSLGSSMEQGIINGSLQGLAAGTLLYVTFFEIFAEKGTGHESKFMHILLAMIGFILMTSFEFLGGHSHGGGHAHTNSHSHFEEISNSTEHSILEEDDHHHEHDHVH